MISLFRKRRFALNENLHPNASKFAMFMFFISSNFTFSLMNALVYVNIGQGIHKGKSKVTWNEKRKKLLGFSFYIIIANFEAFSWTFSLSTNLLFSEVWYVLTLQWCSNSKSGLHTGWSSYLGGSLAQGLWFTSGKSLFHSSQSSWSND